MIRALDAHEKAFLRVDVLQHVLRPPACEFATGTWCELFPDPIVEFWISNPFGGDVCPYNHAGYVRQIGRRRGKHQPTSNVTIFTAYRPTALTARWRYLLELFDGGATVRIYLPGTTELLAIAPSLAAVDSFCGGKS